MFFFTPHHFGVLLVSCENQATVVYNFPPICPNVASRFQEIYLLSQEKFGTSCV